MYTTKCYYRISVDTNFTRILWPSKRIRGTGKHAHLSRGTREQIYLNEENKETNEPRHEISNNVVCATSKASDQPAHTRSLIRAFASRLNIL